MSEHRCYECDGEGWVIGPTHSPDCWGNCSKHGCPIQDRTPCDLCGGKGFLETVEDWGTVKVEFDERGQLIRWWPNDDDETCRTCSGSGYYYDAHEDKVRCTDCTAEDPT